MIEKIIKIYSAQDKPMVGAPIVLTLKSDGSFHAGESHVFRYMGNGMWGDFSVGVFPTKQVKHWHYLVEVD